MANIVCTAINTQVLTLQTFTATPTVINEGGSIQYTFTLNEAVVGAPVSFVVNFSGTEQDKNAYAPVNVTVPVGQSGGTFTLVTTDNNTVDPNRTLVATPASSARLNANSKSATVTINDNDLAVPVNITANPTGAVDHGTSVAYTITLDRPAPAGGTSVTFTRSGSNTQGGNHCVSYDGTLNGALIGTDTVLIPAGQTSATQTYVVGNA